MDEASQPQPLSASMQGHQSSGSNSARMQQQRGGQGYAPQGRDHGGVNYNLQSELMWIKQDATQVRNAVILLEQEKDSLRKAIRKLKIENTRVKLKVKTLQEQVAQLTGTANENGASGGAMEADLDYDDIGRDFMLVGGVHDPLSLRHEVVIRDADGIEHKSAERYYWYKMAMKFDDQEAAKKILTASNVQAAEAAMKEIKNFNEEAWNEEKLKHWEDGQMLKLKQVRGISNLLVYSGTTYIAVASQDKCFGTGWRKNREESNKPIFWDGLNEGGKILMNMRQQLKEEHSWLGPQEEEETLKKFRDLQRFVGDYFPVVWRRIDPAKRIQVGPGRAPVGPRGRVGSAPRRGGGSANGPNRPPFNAPKY